MSVTTDSTSQTGREASPIETVVVAGGEDLCHRVRTSLAPIAPGAAVREVDGFLEAIGELSRTKADVVIGRIELLDGMAASVSGAVRELSPGTRLVVLAEAEDRDAAEQAVEAGFDAALIEPLSARELMAAVCGPNGSVIESRAAQSGPVIADGAARPAPAPAEAETSAHRTADEARGSPSRIEPPAITPLALLDEAMDEGSAAIVPGGEGTEVEPTPGDTDLVEAILAHRGDLAEIAWRVVRLESGLRGVAWVGANGSIPAGSTSAAVRYRGESFGWLHAPAGTDERALSAWSAWLARWLALESQFRRLGALAMRDEMTGVWNRRYFNRFLERVLEWAAKDRSQVTLLVFDIDDFKLYNDRYGHAAGDEILRETAKLMSDVVREQDVVARIGGDEFAVIFWDAEGQRRPGSRHPEDVVQAAKRFQRAICEHAYPKLLDDAPGTLTISGGLASFPWDGRTPRDLLAKADEMALQSKRQGKNVITFGPGALRVCRADG